MQLLQRVLPANLLLQALGPQPIGETVPPGKSLVSLLFAVNVYAPHLKSVRFSRALGKSRTLRLIYGQK